MDGAVEIVVTDHVIERARERLMQGFAHTGFLLIAIAVIARFKVLP